MSLIHRFDPVRLTSWIRVFVIRFREMPRRNSDQYFNPLMLRVLIYHLKETRIKVKLCVVISIILEIPYLTKLFRTRDKVEVSCGRSIGTRLGNGNQRVDTLPLD